MNASRADGSAIALVLAAFSSGTLPTELRRLAYAYGPVWLAAPFALRSVRYVRCGLIIVALCLVSMTFAFDWGRIIFLAAPILFVAAATVVRHRRRLALALVITLFALDVGYGIYLQAYGVQHGIDQSVGRNIPVY